MLKRLTTGEMIQISAPWVDVATPQNRLLRSIEETAVLLVRLGAAHKGLLETQPPQDRDGRQAALMARAAEIDARHDTYARGVHFVATGLALLAPDTATGDAIMRLRELVMPEGLAIVQRTYRDEAGAGRMLAARLDDETRAQLAKLTTPFGTLEQIVDRWIAAAAELGAVEEERAALVESEALGPAAADVVAARNQWIRVMNTILTNLDLVTLDAATHVLLLAPLRDAEGRADRRAARHAGGEATADGDASGGPGAEPSGSDGEDRVVAEPGDEGAGPASG